MVRQRVPRERLVTRDFVLVTVASFAYFASVGALIPTLPVFVEGPLGGSALAVGIVVGSFNVSAFFLRPWIGRMGDRRGRRFLLLAGGSVVTVATFGYLPASSIPALVALRLFAGVGEAMIFVGAVSAISDMTPDERRGEGMSYWTLSLYSGLALGPLLGESVLGATGFDQVWIVAAVLSLAAIVLALPVEETMPSSAEDRGANPVPLVHRAGLLPGVVLLCSVWGFAGYSGFLALYARDDLGMTGAAPVFFMYSGILVLVRSAGARIPDILGPERAATIALATSMIGLAIIGSLRTVAALLIGSVVFAVGQSLAFPALMAMTVRRAPVAERAAAVGTFSAFLDLAFGAGAVSLGAVADAVGYPGSFLVASVVAATGFVVLVAHRARASIAAASGLD